MKNGKAAGHDRVTAEIVKDCAGMLAPKYEELFNETFEFHEEPADINKSLIIPIPKSHKLKTIENIRPITILTTTKLFIYNIKKNKEEIDEVLPPSQSAYRENRSIADNVYTLKALQSQWGRLQAQPFCFSSRYVKGIRHCFTR